MLNPLFELGRIERSKDVSLKFVDSENFVVVYSENEIDKKTGIQTHDKGDMKYAGVIKSPKPHIDNYCTCPSFYHGNSEEFQKAHGVAFSCKHIMRAIEIRYTGYEKC